MQYVATRGHLRNRAVNGRILLKQILRTLFFFARVFYCIFSRHSFMAYPCGDDSETLGHKM